MPPDVETEADIKPVIHEEGITYSYVTHNSLYLLAVSRANANAVSTLYFLHRLVDVFKYYFEARAAATYCVAAHRALAAWRVRWAAHGARRALAQLRPSHARAALARL